jgi:hypothetical protein
VAVGADVANPLGNDRYEGFGGDLLGRRAQAERGLSILQVHDDQGPLNSSSWSLTPDSRPS